MEVTSLMDMTGYPIVIGGRVRVIANTLSSGKNVYKHGEVVRLTEREGKTTLVEIRLFKNLNMITASPEQVQVMKGKTRNSFQYELIKEKFRRRK